MRQDFKERHSENFWQEVTALGGYVFVALVFLTFLLLGDYAFVKKYILGIAIIYAVAFLIRSFYFKDRPQKFRHDSFLERLDASSFPSLHAARSAFVFSMLSGLVQNIYFTALSVILVFLTCYSRLRLKRHDWKDVAAGAVLGYSVFLII